MSYCFNWVIFSTNWDYKNILKIFLVWNRVDCQHFEKKNQNTQEIKRTLFSWTKQDKTCKFSRKSSFSSYVQQKNRQVTHTFSCNIYSSISFHFFLHLFFFWRRLSMALYNLRHACFFITLVHLVPFSFWQPPTSNWHKVSWISLFFVFFCSSVVRSLKKRTSLSCFVQLKNVLLISCVFWIQKP